jgi:hypothetical protein
MSLFKLLRRVRPSLHWQPDALALRTIQAPQHIADDNGALRVSSVAFQPSTGEQSCSVDLGQLFEEDGLKSTALYPSLARAVALYSLTVEQIRAENLELEHQPIWSNWYHGGICGRALDKHRVRKRLAKACRPVIPIDGAEVMRLRSPSAIAG